MKYTQDLSGYMEEPDGDEFDLEGGLGFDCGMTPSGQCMNAGSEDCDECPYWEGALGGI